MSSIRELKKEINYLIDEIIGNCFLQYYFVEESQRIKIEKLIEEIVAFRNDLINRVNNPSANFENKSKRSYYRNIRKELFEKANTAFEKIDRLNKPE